MLSFFRRKYGYTELIVNLNNDLDEANKEILKLRKIIKSQSIRISDLEDNNAILKTMLSEKDIKIVRKSVEIQELKDKIYKMGKSNLSIVK